MTGRRAWQQAQREKTRLASDGVLHMLLDEDPETSNVVAAQLADAEAALWNLTLFGAAAVRRLAEATGQTVERAHADVVESGPGGFMRAWPGPEGTAPAGSPVTDA